LGGKKGEIECFRQKKRKKKAKPRFSCHDRKKESRIDMMSKVGVEGGISGGKARRGKRPRMNVEEEFNSWEVMA